MDNINITAKELYTTWKQQYLDAEELYNTNEGVDFYQCLPSGHPSLPQYSEFAGLFLIEKSNALIGLPANEVRDCMSTVKEALHYYTAWEENQI